MNNSKNEQSSGKNKFLTMAQYSIFAECYDKMMIHVNYEKWASSIDSYLLKHSSPGNRILDAACGTGELVLSLDDSKYKIDCMDLSNDMLNVAEHKNRKKKIKFFQGDIRNIDNDKYFDVVLFLHDSFNYLLTKKDVLSAFKSVYNVLNNNGLFIFDSSTRFNIVKNFNGQTFSDNFEDFSFIWKNRFNRITGMAVVDIEFAIHKDGHTQTGTERHYQRIFKINTIERLIKKSGYFTILSEYDGFSLDKAKKNSDCVTFVLRKK